MRWMPWKQWINQPKALNINNPRLSSLFMRPFIPKFSIFAALPQSLPQHYIIKGVTDALFLAVPNFHK